LIVSVVVEGFLWLALVGYLAASGALMIYGLNAYVMVFLFGRRVRGERASQEIRTERFFTQAREEGESAWPVVTTQLPLYNEYNVAERVIRAAAALSYPAGRHQIQVVDDSTDETRKLVDDVVAGLRESGVWIEVCRRDDRRGYKAGGLQAAMETAQGEFLALFDSDFVPETDFLEKIVPLFDDGKTALVQARWGHLNPRHSLLTRAQSVGIDGHFVVEQVARAANGLFMNFNGTAGVWRRTAIDDSGGWQGDTLTEDLDLSYRCQLKGWKLEYAIDVVVPAELPETYSAFKSQQFRWAKGSVQTAMKLLRHVFSSSASGLAKIQAVFHLLHYLAHPLMFVMALLALPLSFLISRFSGLASFALLIGPLVLATLGPSVLYLVSQRYLHPRTWWKRALYLPGMVALGFGICLSNTRAVLEAVLGVKSGFIRTPKRGAMESKVYRGKLDWVPVAELMAAVYCFFTMVNFVSRGAPGGMIFFLFYGIGFLTVGARSLWEQRENKGRLT
jgi:cellulose synthase/poly-beta-1,6-N-acetylglucosamine synthase-like glycosyltransferase